MTYLTTDADQPPDPTDPPADSLSDLAAEQAHLHASRAALAAMRERAASLEVLGGNEVSAAYLAATLHHRVESLRDDGSTPLFFGRIDYGPAAGGGDSPGRPGERFHIGRRHVHDERGDPMVADWRAAIARPFYRASAAVPMGLELRRRFGFSRGRLTAYEDERLGAGERESGTGSRILQDEIERPRVGPMRDIVATIQPDQDEIVRADLSRTVCVQGAPGTGKTVVGLHRAAYLLYAHRDQLRRSGVLVVGPNRAFLGYIGEVLPALGELTVEQRSVDDLVPGVRIRGADPVPVAALKGDARMAAVLRRAVYAHVRRPDEPVVLPVGSRRWRVGSARLTAIVRDLLAHDVRYGSARAMLPMRVADAILRQMEEAGDSPDDRVLDRVARSRPVRDFVDATWPKLDPAAVVHRLLSDPEALARAADGILDADAQRLLLWAKPPQRPGGAPWSVADAYCIDEAADLIERTGSFGHVVVDEAQDLSAMQCRAIGRRCSTGSATVLGDLAQGTTPWAARDWATSLAEMGKPDAHVEVLTRGYRVPREIIGYANRVLPHIAPGVAPAVSVRTSPGALTVTAVSERALLATAVRLAVAAAAEEGSLAVVSDDGTAQRLLSRLRSAGLDVSDLTRDDAPGRLALVPASRVKGLEFDHVVVVEPAAIADAEGGEEQGLRRLYVVLTRAVSSLTVVHARPLPAALAA
ncbi:MAG: HelD family protein [Frankiaceae bacterium]